MKGGKEVVVWEDIYKMVIENFSKIKK
jgi:hypothetical protein